MVVEIKVVVLGEAGGGKTSLTSRFALGSAPTSPASTVGASFLQKRMQVAETEVCLQLWDTAGQERFRAMAPMYYRGAKAAVLVVDASAPTPTKRSASWLDDLKQYAEPDCVIALAVNKIDLLDDADTRSTLDLSHIEELITKYQIPIHETSALTGEGVR